MSDPLEWVLFNREHASRLSDEVDALRATNERLRAALESIVKHCNTKGMQRWPIALEATAALAQEKPNE